MDNKINWKWESSGATEDDEAYRYYLDDQIYKRQDAKAHTKQFNEAGQLTFNEWGNKVEGTIPLGREPLTYRLTIGYTGNDISIFWHDYFCIGRTSVEKNQLGRCMDNITIDTGKFEGQETKKEMFADECRMQTKELLSKCTDVKSVIANFNEMKKLKEVFDFHISRFDKQHKEFLQTFVDSMTAAFDGKVKWEKRNVNCGLIYSDFYKNLNQTIHDAAVYRKANAMFQLYGVDVSDSQKMYYFENLQTAVSESKNGMILMDNTQLVRLDKPVYLFLVPGFVEDFKKFHPDTTMVNYFKSYYGESVVETRDVKPLINITSLIPPKTTEKIPEIRK